MPLTPNTKAKKIAEAIESSTPNTCAALSSKGISKERERLADQAIVNAAAQTVKDTKSRRSLLSHLNQCNKKAVCERLELSRSYLYYQSRKGFNAKLKFETLVAVKKFYYSDDAVTTYPYKTKSGRVLRIMKYTRKQAFHMFKAQQPEVLIGQTTFNRLKPKDVKLMKQAQWIQCVCDLCENFRMLLAAIRLSLSRNGYEVPDVLQHTFDVIKLTICSTHNPDCLNRKCEQCSTEPVKDLLRTWSTEGEDDFLSLRRWARFHTPDGEASKHLRRKDIEINGQAAFDELISMLSMHPKHVCNARAQASSFKAAKASLKDHEALVVVDFAENFTCRERVEAQSTYWNRNNVTIHPMVAMFNKNKAVTRDSVIAMTPDLKHDASAVKVFIQILAKHLQSHYPEITNIVVWSDGCAAQYKSRVPLYNIAHAFDTTMGITWNFFGSRHGKCEADGEAAVVKNHLDRVVKAEDRSVGDAQAAFHILNSSERKITSGSSRRHFYLISEDEMKAARESPVPVIPPVPGVRSIHQVKFLRPNTISYSLYSCYCEEPCDHKPCTKDYTFCG